MKYVNNYNGKERVAEYNIKTQRNQMVDNYKHDNKPINDLITGMTLVALRWNLIIHINLCISISRTNL